MQGKRRFEFVLPLAIAVGGDVFGADTGDRLQQELGEIPEGDGIFAGDASLGHKEKCLGEGAVDVGGGGQVGAERFEFRSLKGSAFTTAFLFGGVMSAELRRRHFALPSISKGELAARGVLTRLPI